ncbi:MAG TPA: PrgI family protein [Candidatus Paceibacterota bacterium]|nr:PrgI family protein [Candidatus Paceibacterota bacterium]HMO82621.1 PrgI family protein [Candidatus Paceibacterota bacterium]
MQFEVPQFIEIEDKIFGPFTWRQFLYLGGGVGMGVVLFFTAPFWLFLLIGLPLGVLAGALSFYPVNNRPFSFFLEAIIGYFRRQKLYLWKKKTPTVHKYNFTPSQLPQTSTPLAHAAPNSKNITSLARRLELAALQKKDL